MAETLDSKTRMATHVGGFRPGDDAGTWTARLAGALLMAACLAVLLVGYQLEPDPHGTGIGTHQQLGLPSCGFLDITGKPCMTCGMTTSTSLMAHGRPIASIINQPFGALFAFACALGTVLGAWTLYSGMSLAPLTRTLGRPRVWMSLVILMMAAWGYKLLVY